MNGYGVFVWASFALTFLVCAVVYYRTSKTLKKYEKDLPELFILSQVTIVESAKGSELSVEVAHADGVRCPRSWRWVPELVETNSWGPVSSRCAEVLNNLS